MTKKANNSGITLGEKSVSMGHMGYEFEQSEVDEIMSLFAQGKSAQEAIHNACMHVREKYNLKSIKRGARHSASDQGHVQGIHDSACELGADCGGMDKDEAEKTIKEGLASLVSSHKSIKDLGYANLESWDIQNGSQALSMLASIAASEAGQGEVSHVQTIGKIIKALLAWIQDELQEMMTAASEPTNETPVDTSAMMSVNYIKSIHSTKAEQLFKDVLAVKFVGKDEIKSYSMLWGSDQLVDLELDYFTKSTDFWDKTLGLPKPLTFDHGQDNATKNDSVIGEIVSFGDDEIGRWYTAQLNRSHAYRNAVDKLISQKALGSSSDSAPQYVIREQKGKANFIKQWPWFATALTTTPCEPRMMDAGLPRWKSLGIDLPGLASVYSEKVENLVRREQLLQRYL